MGNIFFSSKDKGDSCTKNPKEESASISQSQAHAKGKSFQGTSKPKSKDKHKDKSNDHRSNKTTVVASKKGKINLQKDEPIQTKVEQTKMDLVQISSARTQKNYGKKSSMTNPNFRQDNSLLVKTPDINKTTYSFKGSTSKNENEKIHTKVHQGTEKRVMILEGHLPATQRSEPNKQGPNQIPFKGPSPHSIQATKDRGVPEQGHGQGPVAGQAVVQSKKKTSGQNQGQGYESRKNPEHSQHPANIPSKPRPLVEGGSPKNLTFAPGYIWVTCSKGQLPRHAVEGGGIFVDQKLISSLGIARAYHAGELIPGYYDTKEKVCCISWGGKPYIVTEDYQILVALPGQFRWKTSENGIVEKDAFIGGMTSKGEKLMIGRAQGKILLHTFLATGRIQPSEGGLLVANGYHLTVPKEEGDDPTLLRGRFKLVLTDEGGTEEFHTTYQYLAHPNKMDLIQAVKNTRSFFSKSVAQQ